MLELARWQHLSTAMNVNTIGSRLGLGKSYHLISASKPTETSFKHFLFIALYTERSNLFKTPYICDLMQMRIILTATTKVCLDFVCAQSST